MPADSDAELGPDIGRGLPLTFRPLGVRIAINAAGGLLLVVSLGMWFALPAEIRHQFSVAQIVTILGLGAMMYACGYALARSRVVARSEGLTIVNGYKTRRFEWNEVLAVQLRSGSPWAMLDLSDGTSVAAMGIQGSDGPRAVQQVREVRALVARLTR